MKRLITLLAIILIAVPVSQAKPRVGVIGGFTSTATNLKEWNGKNFSGFHVGLTSYYRIGLGFGVQPSLVYQRKGISLKDMPVLSSSSNSSYAPNMSCNSAVGYVQLPVQLQFGIDLIILRPYVFVEPFVGYALHNSISCSDGPASLTVTNQWEGFDRLEYGLSVGGGLDITRFLQISIKYYWNFDNKDLNVGTMWKQIGGTIKSGKGFNGLQVSAAILF